MINSTPLSPPPPAPPAHMQQLYIDMVSAAPLSVRQAACTCVCVCAVHACVCVCLHMGVQVGGGCRLSAGATCCAAVSVDLKPLASCGLASANTAAAAAAATAAAAAATAATAAAAATAGAAATATAAAFMCYTPGSCLPGAIHSPSSMPTQESDANRLPNADPALPTLPRPRLCPYRLGGRSSRSRKLTPRPRWPRSLAAWPPPSSTGGGGSRTCLWA